MTYLQKILEKFLWIFCWAIFIYYHNTNEYKEVGMKIFSIVIFPPNQKPFSASLTTALFQTDPHEKIIKDNKWRADPIKNQNGIYELKPTQSNAQKDFFYCFIDNGRIAILACDEMISPHGQDALDKKISAAQNSESLMSLIQRPAEAIKSDIEKQYEVEKIKINKIKQELEETKTVLKDALDKIVERGENIKELQIKTEELEKTARSFKKEATKLKNSYYCPGLFSIFTTIKNFVWRDSGYEYAYRPSSNKPK